MSVKKALFVGFAPWKQLVPLWFPAYQCLFASRKPIEFYLSFWPLRLFTLRPDVYVWGKKYPPGLKLICKALSLPFYHVEDGFIRSLGLGSAGKAPLSIVVDSRAPHYDARQPSDLENLLSTYDFKANQSLMQEAKIALNLFRTHKISKYNLGGKQSFPFDTTAPDRILVVGQVPGDAALRYGSDRPLTNKALLSLAVRENPQATIYYKPHPATKADPDIDLLLTSQDLNNVIVLNREIAAPVAIEFSTAVYVNTSLLGFEALLRGKPVTCAGTPFYAGWGVTNDRQPISRRSRSLTISELFAGIYILYPLYLDADNGTRTSALDMIARLIDSGRAVGTRDGVICRTAVSPEGASETAHKSDE
jgi:capsular polysaccharide export protein